MIPLKRNNLLLLILFLISVLFLSCQNQSSHELSTGNVIVHLEWPVTGQNSSIRLKDLPNFASLPTTVTTIRGIVSGPGMANVQKDFPVSAGQGTIDNIPAGTNRAVIMQGLDAAGDRIFQGSTTSIIITAGQTTDAGTITMVEIDTTDTEPPTVTSVYPLADATQVSLSTTIQATFSETMDVSTIID